MMGQLSSQPTVPASTNSTTNTHGDPDSKSPPQVFLTQNVSFAINQALKTPKGYLTRLPVSDPTICSPLADFNVKEEGLPFDSSEVSRKMSDTLAMPPPQRDNAERSDWRQEKANRRKQRIQSDKVSRILRNAQRIVEQQKIKDGADSNRGNTDQMAHPDGQVQTPTQTKKRRRGRHLKTCNSDRRSSNSSSNCHSSIIADASSGLSSFRRQMNQSPTMNRHIKHESVFSQEIKATQTPLPLPRGQLFPATKNGSDMSKSAKKRYRKMIRKMGGTPLLGGSIHNGGSLDEKYQSENHLGQHDQENPQKSNKVIQSIVNSKDGKKKTTISELTHYNENSQRFKSAKIKYNQDAEDTSREAPDQRLDGQRELDKEPVSKKFSIYRRPYVVDADQEDEMIENEMTLVKRGRSGTLESSSSFKSIITDSFQSPATTFNKNINHPSLSYEHNTELLPADEYSSEEDESEEMIKDAEDEPGHHQTSGIQETLLPTVSSAPARDRSSQKRRLIASETDDDHDDSDVRLNKKFRLGPVKAAILHSADDKVDDIQSRPPFDARVLSSELGSPRGFSIYNSKQDNVSLNNVPQLQKEVQKQTRSSNTSRRAYKSAEFIIDSDGDNSASQRTENLLPTDLKAAQESCNVNNTSASRSQSTTPNTPRRLPVQLVKKRNSTARLHQTDSGETVNGRGLPDSLARKIWKKGVFDQTEKDSIQKFKDIHCDINGLSELEFVAKLHENAHNDTKLISFWTDMQDAMGNRDRKSLQRFCRRHWPQAEMAGTLFSKEDDQELIRLIAEHGLHWVKISEIMGRPPGEVRDRYRNVLKDRATRTVQRWSETEVIQLRRAIGEIGALGLIVTTDPEDLSTLISWGSVSAKMEGKRGRAQCSYKWKQLEVRGVVTIGEEIRKANERLNLGLDLSSINLNGIRISGGGSAILEDEDENNEDETVVPTTTRSDRDIKNQIGQANHKHDATRSSKSTPSSMIKIKKHALLRDQSQSESTTEKVPSEERASTIRSTVDSDRDSNITQEQNTRNERKDIRLQNNATKQAPVQPILQPKSANPRMSLLEKKTSKSSSSNSSSSSSNEEPNDVSSEARQARKLQQPKRSEMNSHVSRPVISEAVKVQEDSDDESDAPVYRSRPRVEQGRSAEVKNHFIDDEASETSDDDDDEDDEDDDDSESSERESEEVREEEADGDESD